MNVGSPYVQLKRLYCRQHSSVIIRTCNVVKFVHTIGPFEGIFRSLTVSRHVVDTLFTSSTQIRVPKAWKEDYSLSSHSHRSHQCARQGTKWLTFFSLFCNVGIGDVWLSIKKIQIINNCTFTTWH